MCASPISASDRHLVRLFEASRQIQTGHFSVPTVQLQGHDLAGLLVRPVSLHLGSIALLAQGNPTDALALSKRAYAAWEDAIRLVETERPDMTPLSAVYHFRMASRHADEYQTLARRSLLGWIGGAREKSRFLTACCLQMAGRRDAAIRLAADVAAFWQNKLPLRLPGLADIRARSRSWETATAASAAHSERSEGSAGTLPEIAEPAGPWTLPLRQEESARCAFAAAVLPAVGQP